MHGLRDVHELRLLRGQLLLNYLLVWLLKVDVNLFFFRSFLYSSRACVVLVLAVSVLVGEIAATVARYEVI